MGILTIKTMNSLSTVFTQSTYNSQNFAISDKVLSEEEKICFEVKKSASSLLLAYYMEKSTSSLAKFSNGAFPTPKRSIISKMVQDLSTDESGCEGFGSNDVSKNSSLKNSSRNISVQEVSYKESSHKEEDYTSESSSNLNLAFLDLIEVTESHYSTILPVDKKSDLMNQVFSEFEQRHFGNKLSPSFNVNLYKAYVRNLKAILTLMEANWEGIHHQQGDSLAGACLVMVCQRVGIMLKTMMKDLKPLNKNLFRKLSNIRKSRGFGMLAAMINGVSQMKLESDQNEMLNAEYMN